MPRSGYGKVAVDLANKPPPYIPIFLTPFKLYGEFLIPNSRNAKTKNNKKKSKLFTLQCNNFQSGNYLCVGIYTTGYKAPCIISATTVGSSKVEVSPKLEVSPSAILRKMRRIILPERVLGKPRTN